MSASPTRSSIVTRFAPSPTGLLHLGHALSAYSGWRYARASGGTFLLRIEDIDPGRCRPQYESAILEDLTWLGLDWDGPVRRQSEHLDDYQQALIQLDAMGVLYPCFCSRKDIADEIARSGHAPHLTPQGAEGPLYPGTCRRLSLDQRAQRLAEGVPHALRLDVGRAMTVTGPLEWTDAHRGCVQAQPNGLGDVVLARRDVPTSYHLSVTVDDALQGVTVVTRGEDLFEATHLHRVLQSLLDLPIPLWRHHRLLLDESGRRLSKRDGATTLQSLRQNGATPRDILRKIVMEET